MTPIEKISKAYWDSFYNGMMAVGLRPEDRPPWTGASPTEHETMRCLRHAMEELRPLIGDKKFAQIFPNPPTTRRATLTMNDIEVKNRAGAVFDG